jgi:hypothetical protein
VGGARLHLGDEVDALGQLAQVLRRALPLAVLPGEGERQPPVDPAHVAQHHLDALDRVQVPQERDVQVGHGIVGVAHEPAAIEPDGALPERLTRRRPVAARRGPQVDAVGLGGRLAAVRLGTEIDAVGFRRRAVQRRRRLRGRAIAGRRAAQEQRREQDPLQPMISSPP